MRRADGSFSWSAWDPSKWDHYHHAGIQVNAYRVAPFPIHVKRRRPLSRFFLYHILGIANA